MTRHRLPCFITHKKNVHLHIRTRSDPTSDVKFKSHFKEKPQTHNDTRNIYSFYAEYKGRVQNTQLRMELSTSFYNMVKTITAIIVILNLRQGTIHEITAAATGSDPGTTRPAAPALLRNSVRVGSARVVLFFNGS